MRRALVDRLTRLLGRARRGQRVEPPPGPVNINVGSSLIVAPGWVNVDGSLSSLLAGRPRPLLRAAYRLAGMGGQMSEEEYVAILARERFVHHDLRYGLPFPDACADTVFTSHTLEHLARADGERLVAESLRVLRPGGIVHISVPDLAEVIDGFTAGGRFDAVDALFEDHDLGDYARHRYMYDEAMLTDLLERTGFADVRRCGYQQGDVPDLDLLDRRPGSLVLEATKPA
jgi:predicted SAM-dependent methyltransferase